MRERERDDSSFWDYLYSMMLPAEPANSPDGASKITAHDESRVSFLLCPGKTITNALPAQKSEKLVFPTTTMLNG